MGAEKRAAFISGSGRNMGRACAKELATAGFNIVLNGSVELFSNLNGRETSVSTVRPISTFILAATIKDAPYLMSARTLEKRSGVERYVLM